MKKLNTGVIDVTKNTKYLVPKKNQANKAKLKKIEIQEPVRIDDFLLEEGDVIFVEMAPSKRQPIQKRR